METLDMLDFDMESWNVFSSVAVDGASAQRDLCSAHTDYAVHETQMEWL